MNLTQTLDNDNADHVLNDYLSRVNHVRAKTLRVAADQRAIADTLRRMAEATRR